MKVFQVAKLRSYCPRPVGHRTKFEPICAGRGGPALATLTICGVAFGGTKTVRAATPEWFTCPDSSTFDPRSNWTSGPRNPRVHKPSAGAWSSAETANHARLTATSYAM